MINITIPTISVFVAPALTNANTISNEEIGAAKMEDVQQVIELPSAKPAEDVSQEAAPAQVSQHGLRRID